ncbi:MAG TPA: hypothetical protein PLA31_03990 [Clostridia bacterium]|nr:hypothetical protein [Clostridia bacterium]
MAVAVARISAAAHRSRKMIFNGLVIVPSSFVITGLSSLCDEKAEHSTKARLSYRSRSCIFYTILNILPFCNAAVAFGCYSLYSVSISAVRRIFILLCQETKMIGGA